MKSPSVEAIRKRRQGVRPFLPTPCRPLRLEVRSTTSSTYEFLFAHSPLCCGSNSSARPSFLRENPHRSVTVHRQGVGPSAATSVGRVTAHGLRRAVMQLACPSPDGVARCGASRRFCRVSCKKRESSRGPKLGAVESGLPTVKAVVPETCDPAQHRKSPSCCNTTRQIAG